MSASVTGYNRLAAFYVWLERLAFGNALNKARFSLLAELKDAQKILILGEGDGRFLARALASLPLANFLVLEQSPKMIALAKQRLTKRELSRVQFIEMQLTKTHLAEDLQLATASFDAVVSCFFLDMFEAAEICNLIETFQRYLKATGSWYYVDFCQSQTGFQALYARFFLKLMYRFFAWQTALQTRNLVNPHSLFEAKGFRLIRRNDSQFNFLTTRLYKNVN